MNKEKIKCTDCLNELRRTYIRRMEQGQSRWIPIGYFCPICCKIIIEYPATFVPDSRPPEEISEKELISEGSENQ
jgi:hypothetical protein